jgi:hypothetical protein
MVARAGGFSDHRQLEQSTTDQVRWTDLLADEQWTVYRRVIDRAAERKIRFAVGGGLAFSHYANRWRNTKDIDLYILPEDRDAMIAAIADAGLTDYFEVHSYDRNWIYRSHDDAGNIVDIIWQMANYRTRVDDQWLSRGETVLIRETTIRMLPVEELIWSKLYVLQRDRCDWGDLLNLLFARGPSLDWDHLIDRVGEDRRVLAAVMELFAWACPGRAAAVPMRAWDALNVSPPAVSRVAPEFSAANIRALDSRDWFGPGEH